MVELFANSGDPDQTPHSAASDQGLHCLSITLLGVSRLQWVKYHAYCFTLQLQSQVAGVEYCCRRVWVHS